MIARAGRVRVGHEPGVVVLTGKGRLREMGPFRPRLKMALLLVVSTLSSPVLTSSSPSLTFDPTTGSYRDLSVVIGDELDKAECPQIIDGIKVRREAEAVLVEGTF